MQLIKETGSVMNHLMSGNKDLPVVGKGATELLYSDRHAYEVTRVENNKAWIKQCITKRIDKNDHFSETQEYDYSQLSEHEQEIVFRNNHWRRCVSKVVYIDDAMYDIPFNERKHHLNEDGGLKFIDNITTMKYSYPKINIVFGFQQEYRDHTR